MQEPKSCVLPLDDAPIRPIKNQKSENQEVSTIRWGPEFLVN
jgi:hypothetical protein